METHRIIPVLPALMAAASLCFCSGCAPDDNTVTIGSKNFTEQIILGEIMARLIEEKTDYPVTRKFNLGGTFVCFKALEQGDIDLYPEYTGTGLTAILKKEVLNDKDRVFDIVKKDFAKQYDLVWLSPLGFNNTYTMTMRREQASALGIGRISDLKKHQDTLRSGFTAEFMERPDGYKGLCRTYGLSFRQPPRDLDPGLMYKAIQEQEVDLICGFATDGRIPAFNLKSLEDDKRFFPPYYAAPLVRGRTLAEKPMLKQALSALDGILSDGEMRGMNYAVDQEGKKAADVAERFLQEHKLINP
jgi:glycine betaine/choline ABC-type transport system substrate-binding protein